jgi:hypothetical protein
MTLRHRGSSLTGPIDESGDHADSRLSRQSQCPHGLEELSPFRERSTWVRKKPWRSPSHPEISHQNSLTLAIPAHPELTTRPPTLPERKRSRRLSPFEQTRRKPWSI